MSRENVEIVRAQYEAWNAGDMDAVAADYAPDATVQGPPNWPDHPDEPVVGLAAITKQFARVREVWDAEAVVAHEYVAHGNHVIVPTTWRVRGRGPEVAMEYTNVYTLRRGKIVRLEMFRDHTEALQAVGLTDQDSS